MLRPFILLTLSFFTTTALAQDAIVQGVYNGYAACLLARVSPDGALTPIGYEELPGDIDPAPYRVFGLTGELAKADGAAPAMGECGCLEVPQVELTGAEEVAEGPMFAASTLGAAAPLKLQSLSPENETYIAAAAEILTEQGLPDAPVKLLQVLRTDVEGDGVDEVLFTAGVAGGSLDGHTQGFDAVLGDYAFVALRRLVDGKVKTDLVEASIVADEKEPYSQIIFNLVGLADVTGDGIAELVVEMQGHEFGGFRLYQWKDGAFQAVNDCGCGC